MFEDPSGAQRSSNVGKNRVIRGIYVMSARETRRAARNGHTFLAYSSMLIFAMLHVTKIFTPYGGVIIPIAMLSIINTPKCTGSIPRAINAGRKIGIMMIIVATSLIKHPTMKRNMFTNTRKSKAFGAMEIIRFPIRPGRFSNVETRPKVEAMARIMRATDDIQAVLMRISGRSLNRISL